MKITGISARIKLVLDYLGVSVNNFALNLGYSRSQTIYDILNGKSAPSYEFFHKFENSEYSDIINISWLIAENGNMLKNASNYNKNEISNILSESSPKMEVNNNIITDKKTSSSELDYSKSDTLDKMYEILQNVLLPLSETVEKQQLTIEKLQTKIDTLEATPNVINSSIDML